MHSDARALIEQGDQMFSKRGTLALTWQEMAEQFYPERADFTVLRSLGDDFASNLTTSYPLMVRRDLGNSFGTMLRPSAIEWFHMRTDREDDEDQPAKAWLEWATGVQRRAMYDRRTLFKRASKEADHDMAAFGQSVKTIELNRNADGLLFRCWHLRDCAWTENAEGKISTVHRKWKPTAIELSQLFPGKLHEKVMNCLGVGANRKPFQEFHCRHIVMPADEYGGDFIGKGREHIKWVSIYIDVDNQHLIEAVGQAYFMYVIPRWQTVSGSQYAYSPATVCALPDARLIQAMTLTLLEAGEKATNPPMVAVQQALRGDIAIYAGGITWVDAEYDERLGEVLRPLTQDKSGLPFGADMRDGLVPLLREAFYLDKLTLPERAPEMTAYEVGQRVQDYIRQASPIFEPLEDEDNAAVCETTFEILLRGGAFGSVDDIPQSLRGKDIGFRFESPLHDAIEAQKGNKFFEAAQLLSQALPVYPEAPAHINFRTSFRDALTSTGVPAKWLNSEEETDKIIAGQQQQMAQQELLEQLGQGAQVAKTVGEAGQALGPDALAA